MKKTQQTISISVILLSELDLQMCQINAIQGFDDLVWVRHALKT